MDNASDFWDDLGESLRQPAQHYLALNMTCQHSGRSRTCTECLQEYRYCRHHFRPFLGNRRQRKKELLIGKKCQQSLKIDMRLPAADFSKSESSDEGPNRSQTMRQEEIRDAGFDIDVIATMPDDIQSIFHRTALRRQHSR